MYIRLRSAALDFSSTGNVTARALAQRVPLSLESLLPAPDLVSSWWRMSRPYDRGAGAGGWFEKYFLEQDLHRKCQESLQVRIFLPNVVQVFINNMLILKCIEVRDNVIKILRQKKQSNKMLRKSKQCKKKTHNLAPLLSMEWCKSWNSKKR